MIVLIVLSFLLMMLIYNLINSEKTRGTLPSESIIIVILSFYQTY